MEANKKSPMLVVGEPSGPARKGASANARTPEKAGVASAREPEPKKPSAAGPEAERPAKTAPQGVSADDQELNSPMVRALMQAVDDAEGGQDQAKKELKRLLRRVDKELSEVLGGKSKRLILEANKKPPVPVVGGDGERGRVKVRSLKGVKVLEFNPAVPQTAPGGPEKP
jgi:hypothetical protein